MGFPKMPVKDPNDVKDYGVRWAGETDTPGAADSWLAANETIASSEWILPTGIEEDAVLGNDHDDTKAWVFLTGGAAGQSYEITNRIVTSDGRSEDQTIVVPVKER
jgi:hypothetical protein